MYTVTLVWLACAGMALLRTEEPGSGDRRQWTEVDFRYRVLAAFRGLFGPGAADPLCRGLCPGGSVGLGSDVGAADPARPRWKRLRTVLLSGLLTALLCLPGLPVALRQIPSYRNPNLVVPPVGGYLAELARVYGLGEHLDAAAAQPWVWGLAGWLLIGWAGGGDVETWRHGDTETRRHGEPSRSIQKH